MRLRWTLLYMVVAAGLAAPPAYADDDIKARITAAGDAAKHNADAVIVLDETDVRVRPNGIGTARSHVVTKILREAAIRGQSVRVFDFDPHTNRLEVQAVRVYRTDGKVEDLLVDQKIEQPQTAWGIFWGTRQYVISIPRLAVGDAVETITEMTGFNVAYLGEPANPAGSTPEERNARGEVLEPPVPGHWHDEVHFWSGYPVIEKRYTVRVPKDKPLQSELYNGTIRPSVLLDGDDIAYSFEQKDCVPLPSEPAMEAWPNVAPKLLLATLPTWEDKARWLNHVSEPQLEADDAIRAKVAEIIKNCRTDEEKYTALNHWVAENIRYAGTTRGMCEGYTIHDIKETFRDRCGVCKDKAGMLCGMLRVAGFESYTVMTMARQRVDRIPADQFNHCVTCLRKKDGSLLLLDPTWMPKSRDNWSTLEPLQHVVYGVPEGKELSKSPDFPPEDNSAKWQAQTQLSADGGLSSTLKFVAVGAPETGLRRTLDGTLPRDRQGLFDGSAQRLAPNTRCTELTFTDPVDFSGPMNISCKLAAPHFALGGAGQRYLSLPMMQTFLGDRTLSDLFGNTAAKERKYGLRLRATRDAKFEETITLPAGWKIAKLPDAVDIDGPSAALHFKIDSQPGQIHYSCELVVKRWTIPASEYANYKEVIDKFEELAGRVVRCEVEGEHVEG
jgi:transglutaminase-like putative cysteine protease